MKEQTNQENKMNHTELLEKQNDNLREKVSTLESKKELLRFKLAFLSGYLKNANGKLADEIDALLIETR